MRHMQYTNVYCIRQYSDATVDMNRCYQEQQQWFTLNGPSLNRDDISEAIVIGTSA
jgi:hypothetical protein